MPNMSYCRFENTYRDLVDCLDNMNGDLSEREQRYMERLVDVCRSVIEEYDMMEMSKDEEDDDNDE